MTPPYNEPSASAFLDTGLLQRAGRFALGEADPVAPHATARAEIGRSPQRLGLILRWGTLAADAAIAFGAIVYSGFSGPSVALPILTLVWLLLLRGCGAYRRGSPGRLDRGCQSWPQNPGV
jgi:hypothetical protein